MATATSRKAPTMTAGEIIAELSKYDPERPVLIATDGWYLNIEGTEYDADAEEIAVTIETRDDYDTRQW